MIATSAESLLERVRESLEETRAENDFARGVETRRLSVVEWKGRALVKLGESWREARTVRLGAVMGKPGNAGKALTLDQLIALGKAPGKPGEKAAQIAGKAEKIARAKALGWSWEKIRESLAVEGVDASEPTIRKALAQAKRKGPKVKTEGEAEAAPEAQAKLAADREQTPAATPTRIAAKPRTEPPVTTPGKAPENDLEQHAAFRRRDRKP